MPDAAYLTLGGEGSSRYEEKKSVFLGFARPVTSEGEAISWIDSIRRRYPDARHHVSASRLRDGNLTRFTDDREPAGTAGMPTLDVLRNKDLTDCAICVVRYFGGTLLGTGGLVHAYGSAASDAVNDAGIVEMQQRLSFTLTLTYADFPRVTPLLASCGATVTDTAFGENVTLSGTVRTSDTDALSLSLTDATAGRVSPEWGEVSYFPVPKTNN